VKQFIRYSCMGLALLLAGGQAIRAQQAGFGTLETVSEASIKAKAAAWLKDAGKSDAAAMQQLSGLWSQPDRTITDRLGETFALGNAAAAKLLADARDPQAIPATKVPEVLTDAAQSEFFRANLGMAYVRILSQRRAYDEGLDVLKTFTPEKAAEPSAYLFHRAVFEHALLQKAETAKTINRLLTDALDAPDRYRTVAMLMILDMDTWKEKDLGAVARKMKRIEERLELAKAGQQTQKLQKEVVLRLDELIKEMENKAKKQDKDGPPKDGPPKDGPPGDGPPQECPDGSGDGQQDGNPTNKPSNKGLQDSKLPGGSGDGRTDMAQIKKLQDQWGTLPPRERERLLAALTVGMSPSHRQAIENYFRNIALEQDRPRR
jgi:hypothetical protein